MAPPPFESSTEASALSSFFLISAENEMLCGSSKRVCRAICAVARSWNPRSSVLMMPEMLPQPSTSFLTSDMRSANLLERKLCWRSSEMKCRMSWPP